MANTNDFTTVPTRIENESIEALKKIGEREDRKVSYLIRRAVKEYVERHNDAQQARA